MFRSGYADHWTQGKAMLGRLLVRKEGGKGGREASAGRCNALLRRRPVPPLLRREGLLRLLLDGRPVLLGVGLAAAALAAADHAGGEALPDFSVPLAHPASRREVFTGGEMKQEGAEGMEKQKRTGPVCGEGRGSRELKEQRRFVLLHRRGRFARRGEIALGKRPLLLFLCFHGLRLLLRLARGGRSAG